jgi:hypothetical protein
MRRVVLPPAFAAAFGVLSVVACGSAYQGATAPRPAASPVPAPKILTATCKAYDASAGTMEVITGVSSALREVTFRIHESTEITIQNEPADLASMQPGMVVRIAYRVTSQGNLADRIEVVLDATGMR